MTAAVGWWKATNDDAMDPELANVIEQWPGLDKATRRDMARMLEVGKIRNGEDPYNVKVFVQQKPQCDRCKGPTRRYAGTDDAIYYRCPTCGQTTNVPTI